MNVSAARVQHCLAPNIAGGNVSTSGGSVQVAGDIADGDVASLGFKTRGIIFASVQRDIARSPNWPDSAGDNVAAASCERNVSVDILRLDISGLRRDFQAVDTRHVNFVIHPENVFGRIGGRRAREHRA